MMIKVVIQCSGSLARFVPLGGLPLSEYVDIRDLIVQIHSDDLIVKLAARKKLLNLTHKDLYKL